MNFLEIFRNKKKNLLRRCHVNQNKIWRLTPFFTKVVAARGAVIDHFCHRPVGNRSLARESRKVRSQTQHKETFGENGRDASSFVLKFSFFSNELQF